MTKSNQLPVRFSDLINLFASEAYVPEIHLILNFEGMIDASRLEKALRLLLDAEPVLGCRFVENWRKAFWDPIPKHVLDTTQILKSMSGPCSGGKDALQHFYGDFIDGFTGPQLKALHYRCPDGDILALKINHVSCDAGGFKEVLYRLSSLYNHLENKPDLCPTARNGSRSLSQIYRQFTPMTKLSILRRGLKELRWSVTPPKSLQFPTTRDKRATPRFAFKQFAPLRTQQLSAYARKHAATLNDLFVTAVFRAIARVSNWQETKDKAMRLNGTVDLRRYLPLRQADALCMLSGVYSVIMRDYSKDDFPGTLGKIKAQIDEHKEHHIGLGIMLVLYLMLSPYPYFLKKKAVAKQWRQNLAREKVAPSMTNLGLIDHQKTGFGATAVKNIYMVAPACCPPWFFCGLSGFSDTLTLSCGFYPSSIPVSRVEAFFSLVDEELP